MAKRADVGVGTVSRVLNDHPSVRDSTRQKVLAAIKALNYTPNPIARRLSLGKTLSIAVIAPFFTRPIFVERLRGVEYALASSEYDLILFNVETSARRDDYFRQLPRRERADGLLIISMPPDNGEVAYFLQMRMPTVLIDAAHSLLHGVTIDDVTGGRLATQHLIDLGHRQIGFVSDQIQTPFNFVSNRDRLAGYSQAINQAGLPARPEYQQQGGYGREPARELTRKLLTQPDPPTAIFAASDTQAIGVLEAARDLGLNVPQQLSVIGYDDIEISQFLQLTTIRQPSFAMGVEGVRLLLETIANPVTEPQNVLLPVELIERGTTAPPQS